MARAQKLSLVFLASILICRSAVSLTCSESEQKTRYRVSVAGLADFFIPAIETDSSVEDFYAYNPRDFSASPLLTNITGSAYLLHHDTTKTRTSLVLVNNPISMPAHWQKLSLRVSNLPAGFELAVKDDECCDVFQVDRVESSVRANFKYRFPFSDGMAIRLPDADLCVNVEVESSSEPITWSALSSLSGTLTLPQFDSKVFTICSEAYCPDTTAVPQVPGAELPICADGEAVVSRWEVSSEGHEPIVIRATETDDNVEKLYNYRTAGDSQFSAKNSFNRRDKSVILVHRDNSTEEYSLMVQNGMPTKAGNGFVRLDMQISGLPDSALFAVRDDPTADGFALANNTALMSWLWKRPYTDGAALRMPNKDFCVDVEVIVGSHSSLEFLFISEGAEVTESSIPAVAGTVLNICYKPACEALIGGQHIPLPSPTPTPSPPVPFATQPRYRVESGGAFITYIYPYESAQSASELYGYSRSHRPSFCNLFKGDNYTSLVVHHDTANDRFNLIVHVGTPQMADSSGYPGYVHQSLSISNAPANSEVVVRDDPGWGDQMKKVTNTDIFCKWRVLYPYVDGVAIDMATEDFCVDLTVEQNSFSTAWNLLSGSNLEQASSDISNSKGSSIKVCYDTETVDGAPLPSEASCLTDAQCGESQLCEEGSCVDVTACTGHREALCHGVFKTFAGSNLSPAQCCPSTSACAQAVNGGVSAVCSTTCEASCVGTDVFEDPAGEYPKAFCEIGNQIGGRPGCHEMMSQCCPAGLLNGVACVVDDLVFEQTCHGCLNDILDPLNICCKGAAGGAFECAAGGAVAPLSTQTTPESTPEPT
eukprot:CAMPEP_0198726058 /NCGR_PEP_ID=MMETSP1475-20131203/3237_1 /TAXON_ID= ORGANISM="Unidentified sp., Strain CCMP1999" /NCGR_SAMPLE_ID=MMETSP1475 /ASSEMBLY_ACC=CAM_ASM_001111 /LENGTH=821 /DNA_ID=CAMNT_0044487937 /DNA_START=83 /DNA_END=2544 /DNA_ORIENTATION=+